MPTPPRFKPTKRRLSECWKAILGTGKAESIIGLDAITRLADAVEMQNEINKSRDIKAINRQGACLAAFVPEAYWKDFQPEVVDAARNCEATFARLHDDLVAQGAIHE